MNGDTRLNVGRLVEKAAAIREALAVLRGYAELQDEVFLGNSEAIRSARYAFIVMIEAAINIAAHLCTRLLGKAPATYGEAFRLLAAGFIDDQLANRLTKMAGFRNLLVHGYAEVDDASLLKQNLLDFLA